MNIGMAGQASGDKVVDLVPAALALFDDVMDLEHCRTEAAADTTMASAFEEHFCGILFEFGF
jgi:hypothetical protein